VASFGGSESIYGFDDGDAFSARRWSTLIVHCRAAQPGSEEVATARGFL